MGIHGLRGCIWAACIGGVIMSSAMAFGQAETVRLSNEQLQVEVATDVPIVLSYTLESTGGVILGAGGRGAPSAVVSRRGGQPRTVPWAELSPVAEVGDDAIVFHCTAKLDGQAAVTFDYAIRLQGNTVLIAMENVREAPGYDLNEWLLPDEAMIRVTNDLPGARICVGDFPGEHWRQGDRGEPGRIVSPGEPLAPMYHFGLVYTERAAAGMFTNSLHKMGEKPVRPLVSNVSTGLASNHHRFSYKDENYEPYWCRIGIVGDVNGDDAIDWKDAACFIHDAIPMRVQLNQDSTKYMLNHGMDFEGAPEDVFRKVCNLSDGHPQQVLLSGWNGWGWDSEYPTWNHPGEEYGGREGLYHLHRNAAQYRAYTSMIHNFDDAYRHTRMWDESIIARKPDGSLVDATWWSGGPSFIIGPYRFWKTGKAKETVDGLIAQGVQRQIFSDVFTIIPWRDDADPSDPADPETNLVLGKFRLLDYLQQRGISMNSEGFNYEMLGRYIGGHNGYDVRFDSDPNRPPLAFFICHGIVAKKMWSAGDDGRFRGADTEVRSPFEADQLYRWSMLISFYGDKPMRDFRPIEGGFYARYGDDVEVTWQPPASQPAAPGPRGGGRGRGGSDGGVRVVLDGRLIADGRSVLLPKPERGEDMWNVLRAYSSNGQVMRYPKPANWTDIDQLTVMALTAENPPTPVANEGKVRFEGDELVINIPQGQPFKLVYGRDLVDRERTFEPLPVEKDLTYPLEEVIAREGGDERPPWIRLKTRRQMELPENVTLAVGSSSIWPTKEEAQRHAANIIARKMAWFVRQSYIENGHTRSYEDALNARNRLGFENWYLGYDAAMKLYSYERILANPQAQWYFEQVRYGPDRQVGWKAFVCIPLTPEDGKEVYLQAARDRLEECRQALEQNPAPQERERLELNIQVYELLLREEQNKAPEPIRLQV